MRDWIQDNVQYLFMVTQGGQGAGALPPCLYGGTQAGGRWATAGGRGRGATAGGSEAGQARQGGARQAGHRRGPRAIHAAIRGRSRGHSIAASLSLVPYPAQACHPRPYSPAALGHPRSIPPCAGPSPPLFPPAQAQHPPARGPIPPYRQGGSASVNITNVIKLKYDCN